MADIYDGGVDPDGMTPDIKRAAEKRAAAIAADRGTVPSVDDAEVVPVPSVKARKQTTR